MAHVCFFSENILNSPVEITTKGNEEQNLLEQEMEQLEEAFRKTGPGNLTEMT